MWICEYFEYGCKFFTKTQISQLKIDDARAALSERGLDSSGSRLELHMRLRNAIHPDISSQSDMNVSNSLQDVNSSVVLLQHSYPERLLGWKKFPRHGTFISQFYTHQCTTFWKKQNFLTRAFFSTDRLVVLPYKAKWHSRGEITKGSTFLSDRIL